jgi:hypothetical protein
VDVFDHALPLLKGGIFRLFDEGVFGDEIVGIEGLIVVSEDCTVYFSKKTD